MSFTCVLCSSLGYAQVGESSFSEDNQNSENVFEGDENADEYDEEATIIEVESSEYQEIVDAIYSLDDLIEDYKRQDTLFEYFAIYKYSPEIVAYIPSKETDTMLAYRYDAMKGQNEQGENFTYIKEYIFNNNSAWDFIYERIYDKDSKLCYFVRRYNTYNSGCAEVALEKSEYFFNPQGEVIMKTYSIYDSNNKELDLDNCWMERESYEKYMTLEEFLQTHPIPFSIE